MQNDELLTQAADHVYCSLRSWQREPDDEKRREDLLLTCKHYLNQGLIINLKPDSVVVRRRDA